MSGSIVLNTNIALAGLPNQSDAGVLYAGSSATDSSGNLLGPGNLQNPKLSVLWRSAFKSPSSCWLRGDSFQPPHSVGCVALVGHNLNGFGETYAGVVTPTGQWRWRSIGRNGSAGNPIMGRVLPQTLLVQTNLTGAVAAIQDPDPEHPGATWLTATSAGSAISARVNFLNSSTMALSTASNAQSFRVLLRRTAAGTGSPTVTFTLYETGVSRGVIYGPVTLPDIAQNLGGSPTEYLFTLPWSATLLSTTTTDLNVQLQIDGSGTSGSSIELGGVEWIKEYTTSGSYTYLDSGWMPIVLPISYPQYSSPLTETFFPGATNFDSFWIDFQDSANTATYFQIGRLIVSTALTFQIGVDYGWGISYNDYSQKTRTKGGNPVNQKLYRVREFVGQLTALTQQEAYAILDQLDRMKGLTGDFLCVIQPDDPNFRYMRTLYCQQLLLNGAQNQDALVAQWTIDRYQRKLLFEERF